MRNLGSWLAVLTLTSACAAGDAGRTTAATTPPATTTPTTSATTTTSSTTSTAPTTTSTTTTTTAPTTTSTTTSTTTTPTVPEDPVRSIGTAGDSLLLGVIPPFQRALERSGYDFRAQWFIGFLAGRDRPYWEEAVADPPDVLVVLFGPWELAALDRGDLDLTDAGWIDVYVRDYVDPALDRIRHRDTEVIWIGVPPSADPVESQQYEFLNAIWRDVVRREPSMTWLDGGALLAGPDGGFAGVDDTVSPPVRLFQTDGRHLCPAGGRRIAEGVLALLEERHGVEVDPGWVDTDWDENTAAYDHDQCRVG